MNDMHTADVSAPSTTPVSITMTHAQLATIASLAACAASDDTMPIIGGIHLQATDGRLIATATDRYVAGSIELYGDTFSGEFELTAMAHVLTKFVTASKLTGRHNTDVARITLTVEGSDDTMITMTLSDSATGASVTSPTIRGTFPPLERLFPVIDDAPASIGHYGISATLLAKLAKINVLGEKNPTWIVQHGQSEKIAPVLYHVPVAGRALIRVLVQPKRINL
jgi:hypothetical protein